MILSDAQIERYCRQIILPEVGSLGQEKLLRATIAIRGAGMAASVATAYLAAAGVGAIEAPAARSLATGSNPDCRRVRRLSGDPDVAIEIGPLPESFSWARQTAGLWGDVAGDEVRVCRFVSSDCCASCLAGSLPDADTPGNATDGSADVLLGALLATAALRQILDPARGSAPEILRVSLHDSGITTSAVVTRPGCPTCQRR